MNKPSRTDWARIDAMTDDEIDTSDIPPMTEEFFAKATLWKPPSERIKVQPDVDAECATRPPEKEPGPQSS
jgi:hypothetical protein